MSSFFDTLRGKRVLITGASSGIGTAIAKIFSQYGSHIGIHYHSSKDVAGIINDIKKTGGRAEAFQGDLLQKKVRETLVQEFVEKFNGIDVLVNNAGAIFEYKHFTEVTEEEWDKMFVLHTKAPFILSQKAYHFMAKQKWGRIINTSTNAIKYTGANIMHYYAAKAALEAITLGFSKDGMKHNVLVNAIRCGNIDTLMHKKIPGYSSEKHLERVQMIPLGRAGKVEEIAQMVLFLASSASDFTTGQIIAIAGGE